MTFDKHAAGAKAGKIDTSGMAFPKTSGKKIYIEKVCKVCGAKFEKGTKDHAKKAFPGERCDGKKRTPLKQVSDFRAQVEQPNKDAAYAVANRRDRSADGKTYCQILLAFTGKSEELATCCDHVEPQSADKPGKTEVDNLLSASWFMNSNRDDFYTATRTDNVDGGATITLIGKESSPFAGIRATRDQHGLTKTEWERTRF